MIGNLAFTNGAFASTTPPFSPGDIPGLVDWWSADSGVTISSGTNVSNWLGINGYNLTRNTNYINTAKFNSSDSNFGNEPSITFNAASMYMNTAYSGVVNPTMIVIGKVGNTYGQYNGIIGLSQIPGYNPFGGAGRFTAFNSGVNQLNMFSEPPNAERTKTANNWNDTDVFYYEIGFDNPNNIVSFYTNPSTAFTTGLIFQDTQFTYDGTFSGAAGSSTDDKNLFVSEYGQNIGGNGINTYTDVLFIDGILDSSTRSNLISWAQSKYSL